jgi:hypothetical protein
MNAKYFAELAMSPSAPIRRKSKQKFFLVEQQILLTFSRAFIKYGCTDKSFPPSRSHNNEDETRLLSG